MKSWGGGGVLFCCSRGVFWCITNPHMTGFWESTRKRHYNPCQWLFVSSTCLSTVATTFLREISNRTWQSIWTNQVISLYVVSVDLRQNLLLKNYHYRAQLIQENIAKKLWQRGSPCTQTDLYTMANIRPQLFKGWITLDPTDKSLSSGYRSLFCQHLSNG